MGLPGWQALHAELEPRGLTVVTVALDIEPEHTYKWIDAAAPTHPAVIDTRHVTGELFGFVNIPMAVWIDEAGMLVRPAESAAVERSGLNGVLIAGGLQVPHGCPWQHGCASSRAPQLRLTSGRSAEQFFWRRALTACA